MNFLQRKPACSVGDVVMDKSLEGLFVGNTEQRDSRDGRCFHATRTVTLFAMSSSANKNRICHKVGYLPTSMFKVGSGKHSFQCGAMCSREALTASRDPPSYILASMAITASWMSVFHLATQFRPLVILIPSYHIAGLSFSRKHGLARFVHARLKWTLFDRSPSTSEIEWIYVDIDGYKIVNIYKPHATCLQVFDLLALQYSCSLCL